MGLCRGSAISDTRQLYNGKTVDDSALIWLEESVSFKNMMIWLGIISEVLSSGLHRGSRASASQRLRECGLSSMCHKSSAPSRYTNSSPSNLLIPFQGWTLLKSAPQFTLIENKMEGLSPVTRTPIKPHKWVNVYIFWSHCVYSVGSKRHAMMPTTTKYPCFLNLLVCLTRHR
jgi:hypothetical protein